MILQHCAVVYLFLSPIVASFLFPPIRPFGGIKSDSIVGSFALQKKIHKPLLHESKTQLHAAYHPLRKLVVGGNPNALFRKTSTTPLQEFLKNHGITLKAYKEYTDKLIGTVVTPLDGDLYSEGRKLVDNAFDKYPLWITYCQDVADVVATIKFAQTQGVQISARAGGHSTAGYSALDESIMIDVTAMKGIHVDPRKMKVIIGVGVRWGMLNHALDAYGFHTPGGSCADVGCSGFTLGGGYGYTAMRFGMACDQLAEVTVVTANGDVVVANEKENEYLFWAHRGGTGGNFGIVTSLTYHVHKLKEVWHIYLNWLLP